NPREARPIAVKRPMHLVMRSPQATGARSFLMTERARKIQALIHRAGKEHGVRVYRLANSGNHLHLIVQPRSREAFHGFLRAITGVIARITLGRERGLGRKVARWGVTREKAPRKEEAHGETAREKLAATDAPSARRFWDSRPFTRILEWGRDYRRTAAYLLRN